MAVCFGSWHRVCNETNLCTRLCNYSPCFCHDQYAVCACHSKWPGKYAQDVNASPLDQWAYTPAVFKIFLLTIQANEQFRSLPCTALRLVKSSFEPNQVKNINFHTLVRSLEIVAVSEVNTSHGAMKTRRNVPKYDDFHPYTRTWKHTQRFYSRHESLL